MSAQPVYDPRQDPSAILERLPAKWHARFLADYRSALATASSDPAEYHQVPELLHLWWMRSQAYSHPGFDQAAADAAESTERVPAEQSFPAFAQLVADSRRRA
ncbi:DUF6247 family protein [Nonomuraea sp. NPDC050663]|uniref:DUF6247 family protein n=1 Tax=Nonomuraea sp. NPDC050663 TaxID=3364370 RepID=UPI0037B48A3F